MKNSGKVLKTVLALLFIASLLVAQAAASSRTVTATLTYRDIRLEVNGNLVTPKDVAGNIVEPFIIDGTTYLPVRAVGNALALDVTWDADTSTVFMDGKVSGQWDNYIASWALVILHSTFDDLDSAHRDMEHVMKYIELMYQSALSGYLTADNSSGYFKEILDLLGEDGKIIKNLWDLRTDVTNNGTMATDNGYSYLQDEAWRAIDDLFVISTHIVGMHNALASYLGGVDSAESDFESMRTAAESSLGITGKNIRAAAESTIGILARAVTE